MPSSSKKQHNFMAAIANNPSFAKKVGVSQSVGKDFNAADKGKTFNKGGMMKKRRFDEGGEIDYEVDENAEPERRSFGSGVSAKDREYNEPVSKPAAKAKPKAKPEAKPAAKESDASESAYTKAAKASFLGSPGKYLSEPLKRMRERMSSGDQQAFKPRDRGFNKGGMMKKRRFGDGGDISGGMPPFEKDKYKPRGGETRGGETRGGAQTGRASNYKMPTDTKKAENANRISSAVKDAASMSVPGELARRAMSKFGGSDTEESLAPGQYRLKKGGMMKESKAMVGKEVAFFKKKGAPASMIKHEKAEMKGYAKGGGIESKGKTQGTMIKMATGGSVSRRADGIAQRGKTKFKNC